MAQLKGGMCRIDVRHVIIQMPVSHIDREVCPVYLVMRTMHERLRENSRVVLVQRADNSKVGVHRVVTKLVDEFPSPALRNEQNIVIELVIIITAIRLCREKERVPEVRYAAVCRRKRERLELNATGVKEGADDAPCLVSSLGHVVQHITTIVANIDTKGQRGVLAINGCDKRPNKGGHEGKIVWVVDLGRRQRGRRKTDMRHWKCNSILIGGHHGLAMQRWVRDRRGRSFFDAEVTLWER
mmetsp:Transcript_45119/g.106422  ORF Transcript_45119/g.106422 Transcript_45119/m.106422 type:complete len:241 (-) Transcript_45119:991-1713(-)